MNLVSELRDERASPCRVALSLGFVQRHQERVRDGTVTAVHIEQEALAIPYEEPSARLVIDDGQSTTVDDCTLTLRCRRAAALPVVI